MSISAPRIRLASRPLDAVPEEDVTLALSTRLLSSAYSGPCVQVRRDPPENALVFVSKVDGVYNDRLNDVAAWEGDVYTIGQQRGATFQGPGGTLVAADYGSITPCVSKISSLGTPAWVSGIAGTFLSDATQAMTTGIDGNTHAIFAYSTIFKSATTLAVYDASGTATQVPWSTLSLYGAPLVKYSPSGNVTWTSSVRSSGYNMYGTDVASDDAGGVYICGGCYVANSAMVSNVNLYDSSGVVGATLLGTGSYGVGYVSRLSSTGNVAWAAGIDGSSSTSRGCTSLASDRAGGVYCGGTFSTNANVMHANNVVSTSLVGSGKCAFIARYDVAGTVSAAFKATDSTPTNPRITTDETGNVYLAAEYTGRNVYHSNNALAGQLVAPTGSAAALIKFNSDLKVLWYTSIDGARTDSAASLAADGNGVFLSGTYATTAGGTANIYHANTAVAGVLPATSSGGGFLVSYSPSGNVTSWLSGSSGAFQGVSIDSLRNRLVVAGHAAGNANIVSQTNTVLANITGQGGTEAGFLISTQRGSTLKDIGFKGRSLDIAALKTHCPLGSNGYVQSLYSQKGLGGSFTEEYPPAPMTNFTTTLTNQTYGNGDYVANVSSTYNNNYGWRAFDRGLTAVEGVNTWLSAQFTYTSPTGVAVNTTAIVDGVGVAGEWVQIKLPVSIVLSGYGIMAQSNYLTSWNPYDFTIAGSNDGVTWTHIDTRVSQTGYVAEVLKQFTVSPTPTVAYQYYRLIISKIPATTGSLVALGEWRLYTTYTTRDARQLITSNQPLLIENGNVSKTQTGSKSLHVPYDASAAETPTYIGTATGTATGQYTTSITSSEIIGTRVAYPSIATNQQDAFSLQKNAMRGMRATLGSAPIVHTLSTNAQTSCLAAFSFRRLFATYNGPVVRLRRESDNAERDFYGLNDAITAWLGGGSARLVTMWDQSGNGKHATQSLGANQPLVTTQFGKYVAYFNGTSSVPHFMTFADIYPASFWAQYYINVVNNSFTTLFARANADFGFRRFDMTNNSNDFLGTNTDVKSYWMINGAYGSNNQNPKSVSWQVWNRVSGSRMTGAGPINSLGRGLTGSFRDFNGFLSELVFFSKPLLVRDSLVLDASPYVKTTSSTLSQTLNSTIGRLGALVSRGFADVLAAVQTMTSFATTSSGPRTATGSFILNNENFGSFQYLIKNGAITISAGYDPLEYFSSVQDTAAAIVVINGNLIIEAGCIFTPPVRKLFTIIHVTGNLVLEGEVSMTSRGANHNATGTSGFASVFPGKNIKVFDGTYGDLFGATNAFVPASGGGGGTGVETGYSTSVGGPGGVGTTGGSGGGGTGGSGGGTTFRGNGAAGTSFSGGTGGGGASQGAAAATVPLPGEPNGGLGGAGTFESHYNGAGNGPNGSGGTLCVICRGTVSGSGRVTSHGSLGNAIGSTTVSGGGSGGGSVWLLAGNGGESVKVTATGGGRAGSRGGLGGNGSAMKIALKSPSISSATRASVVGAYSLRRLFSSWGGPVVRIRHGTTNEQRNFYAEDLSTGAALDAFVAGNVAYVSIWYDQSGANNNAVNATTTSQPILTRNASWTTKPTLTFAGAQFLPFTGTGLVNIDYSVAVSTSRSSNVTQNWFMGGTTLSAQQNLVLGYPTDTQITHSQYGLPPIQYSGTLSPYISQTPETFVFRHSTTLGKNMYRNGTFLASGTSQTSLTSYTGSAIGRYSTSYYFGDISEVILCASYVSDTERALLETSMMSAV